MFSNILVPIDGTAQSNAALPLARAVARQTSASLTLLRVAPSGEGTSDRESFAQASESLKRVGAELTTPDVHVETVLRQGDDVAEEILQQSRTGSADLILMRTHGRAGLERAVLGSVTERVLAESGVPVMLFRPGGRRVNHIGTLLVPMDGSPGGAVALGIAVGLAKTTGAEMKLLEVVQPIPTWVYAGDVYGGMAYYDPAWDEEAFASGRAYIDGLVKRLRNAGLTIEGLVRQQPGVADTIVAVAQETGTDVIVMSTQALTGPARALLGSVADAVVRSADCPVLLTHRTERASRVHTGSESVPTAVPGV